MVRSLRLAGLALVALILSLLGMLSVPTAYACACGGFVAADGEDVAASAEYAVLTFDGTNERVLMSINALADTSEAALLIPTPSPATAALAETSIFPELDRLTAPEEVVEYRWWPRLSRGDTAGAPGAAGGAPVSVLQTRRLGDLEVTTLAATDPAALARWLNDNGYVMPAGFAAALTPYVAEGWFYTAIRLSTDAADLSGALQPLDLTFRATGLVYPMRLSSAATSSQYVRTYVFAEHRVQRTDLTAQQGRDDVRFAGRIDPAALQSPSLRSIVAEQPYLTAIEQYLGRPSEQVVSDFTFGPAADDTPYRRTTYEVRMRTIFGLPAGPVLTVLAVAAVLLGATVTLRRKRAAATR